MRRRVVVTGIGVVSPLGVGGNLFWKRLLKGESGLVALKENEIDGVSVKYVGRVPRGSDVGQYDSKQHILREHSRTMGVDYIGFAIAAASEALEMSGLGVGEDFREDVGVSIGSGIGGLEELYEGGKLVLEGRGRRVSPFMVPRSLVNMASGAVSLRWKLGGPNMCSSSACAAGAHSILDAFRLVRDGYAEGMVAGGTESVIGSLGMVGFERLRALSSGSDVESASCPFDEGRSGFVLGEGCGIVVIESLEHARQRNATILAEIVGAGFSSDAHHATQPPSDGNGALRAMRMALSDADVTPNDLSWINAHATSTPLGDEAEIHACEALLHSTTNTSVPISSIKGHIGHLLGAAGAVEAVASIQAIQTQTLPPTANLQTPLPTKPSLKHLTSPLNTKVNYVLSNSFGFGGTNTSILFRKFQ